MNPLKIAKSAEVTVFALTGNPALAWNTFVETISTLDSRSEQKYQELVAIDEIELSKQRQESLRKFLGYPPTLQTMKWIENFVRQRGH